MTDSIAFRAAKRAKAREEKAFNIRVKQRQTLDTGYVETDQPLQPYTGLDHSKLAVSNAVDFWNTHQLPEWMADGSCRDAPQEMFYGSEDRRGKARHHPNLTVDEVAKARRVCNACPVQMECLDWAIRTREEFGIWGGSTAGQRKRWIKQFEERHMMLIDDVDMDLTSYDDVYGGYDDEEEDLFDVG